MYNKLKDNYLPLLGSPERFFSNSFCFVTLVTRRKKAPCEELTWNMNNFSEETTSLKNLNIYVYVKYKMQHLIISYLKNEHCRKSPTPVSKVHSFPSHSRGISQITNPGKRYVASYSSNNISILSPVVRYIKKSIKFKFGKK